MNCGKVKIPIFFTVCRPGKVHLQIVAPESESSCSHPLIGLISTLLWAAIINWPLQRFKWGSFLQTLTCFIRHSAVHYPHSLVKDLRVSILPTCLETQEWDDLPKAAQQGSDGARNVLPQLLLPLCHPACLSHLTERAYKQVLCFVYGWVCSCCDGKRRFCTALLVFL